MASNWVIGVTGGWIRTLAVAVSAAAVLAACSDTSAGGSSFTVSMALLEPAAIDPLLVNEAEGAQVSQLLFDGLTTVDADLNVVPAVAESWDSNADGTVHTFHLRSDSTFSNGTPVTADDFVHAFGRAADPDAMSEAAYQGFPIAGWEDVNGAPPSGVVGDAVVPGAVALDPRTLQITTSRPFSLLPALVSSPVFSPVPKGELDSPEKAAAYADMPIGNGPYKMDGPWQHDQTITLERRDDYVSGPEANPSTIEFKIFSDDEDAYREVQADTLDIAAVPDRQMEAARTEFGDRLVQSEIGSLVFIGLPISTPPFSDARVRQALSMAFDREAIADRTLSGTAAVARGFVPSVAPGAIPDVCSACEYKPQEAKDLLQQAGGITSPITLYGGGDEEIAQAIANDWRTNLGIETRIVFEEQAAFVERMHGGALPGPAELSWSWDYPSSYSFLGPLFGTASLENLMGYSNAQFDRALSTALAAPDEVASLGPLGDAQRIVAAPTDLPGIPVVFIRRINATSDRVSNVIVNGLGFTLLEQVQQA